MTGSHLAGSEWTGAFAALGGFEPPCAGGTGTAVVEGGQFHSNNNEHPRGMQSSMSAWSVVGSENTCGETGEVAPNVVQKVPYQQRTFADFCMLIGRLFYDDGSVVLLDFLVREQRAYTEADIRERLKWKDNLLHQKLYFLERQLLVQREQNFEKGNKSPIYWRVSPHIVLAVEWHYGKLLADLQNQVEASHRLQEFECPTCRAKHSALDAASGLLSLDDEHPLCRKCGEKLCISNSEEAKSEVRDKHERTVRQLAPLRASLDRVRNMDPPVFAPYTRADKNEQKRELEEKFNPSAPSDTSTAGGVASQTPGSAPPTTAVLPRCGPNNNLGGGIPTLPMVTAMPSCPAIPLSTAPTQMAMTSAPTSIAPPSGPSVASGWRHGQPLTPLGAHGTLPAAHFAPPMGMAATAAAVKVEPSMQQRDAVAAAGGAALPTMARGLPTKRMASGVAGQQMGAVAAGSVSYGHQQSAAAFPSSIAMGGVSQLTTTDGQFSQAQSRLGAGSASGSDVSAAKRPKLAMRTPQMSQGILPSSFSGTSAMFHNGSQPLMSRPPPNSLQPLRSPATPSGVSVTGHQLGHPMPGTVLGSRVIPWFAPGDGSNGTAAAAGKPR